MFTLADGASRNPAFAMRRAPHMRRSQTVDPERADSAAGQLEQYGASHRPQAKNHNIDRLHRTSLAGCRIASGMAALISVGMTDARVSLHCAIPAQVRARRLIAN